MKPSLIPKWCRWSALALLVATSGRPGSAEEISPSLPLNALTMESAIQLALENHPELHAADARVDAATGRAYQAKLWTNPELELNAEDWPVREGRGFSDAKQTLGVAQTIPFPGKKPLDRQIGASGVRLSEAERGLRRLEVIRDTKTAFFRALAAERLVEVAGELVTVAASSAVTARQRVAAGAAADQEQLRAEIPLEQARSEQAGYQLEWVAAQQALAWLLGRPDLAGTPLSGSLAETASLSWLDQEPEPWLTRHPSALAVKARRDRAELEWRRVRLDPYPDVKIGVAGGRVGESGESIVELGFSLPLPIIDRGKGRKQEAQAHVRMAEADQRAIEQRLGQAWATARQRLRTALEQATAYRERILPKANEALRLVQTGFEQGKFGFIDLLDTQRTTAEVRLAYQQKLLELNVAQAELEFLVAGNRDGSVPGEFHPSRPNP